MRLRLRDLTVVLGCAVLPVPLALFAQAAPPSCLPGTTQSFATPAPLSAGDSAPGKRSVASADRTGSLQTYDVPTGATAILIVAHGASGGASTCSATGDVNTIAGGLGAAVTAEVPVIGGSTLDVVVGAQGTTSDCGGTAGDESAAGGGGGSFVFTPAPGNSLLVAAGGGGGAGFATAGTAGDNAQTGTAGSAGGGAHGGYGGSAGTGGNTGNYSNSNGGGGAGFLGGGTTDLAGLYSGHGGYGISSPGDAFGGAGGSSTGTPASGGYGGGGGGGDAGGGGGGGYSGGGGGAFDGSTADFGGGGGGSYIASSATYSQSILATAGDGSVTICVTQEVVTAIPTLSIWALIALALCLALAATPMLIRRS